MAMKKFILLILLGITFVGFSQDNNEREDKKFIVLYTLGEQWDNTKPPNEQLHFSEHSSFLSGFRTDKKILLGARYSNTGMIVLLASDEEAANSLIRSDPAVQHHLFAVEIFPFSPFYNGCIEYTD